MVKKCAIVLGQVILFVLISRVMNALASYFQLPVPGSILGLLLVFLLLQTRLVPLSWIGAGAQWLLAEMLLFFVPSAVSMVQYKRLLLNNGWQIALVVLASTTVVMIISGLLAQRMAKPQTEPQEGMTE
ncbi:CidA/LrgA family protein [Paenibacillus sp. y28]|uniref:CidA/LrgA family protein n=1 Tax=Paenibacillus sp. y28 TaxID=3129110 RepID=UPI00301869ED